MAKRARIAATPARRTVLPAPSDGASEEHQPTASSSQATSAAPSTFKIVVGTYEKLLYGLEGRFETGKDSLDQPALTLTPIFIFPAHVACVRAVAASPQGGKWLATGSTDEIIKVWDLRRRKEVGGLIQHQGSITHLSFPSRSHLLSASEDGTLGLFSTRDWVLLRTLKGHKGKINDVAMHPSGKLALSVGKDRTLRMWDMMRGKGAASTKLGKEGELVRWSLSGKLFVVQTASTLDIFQTDMTMLDTITHPSRIHDLKFCRSAERDILLVAGEDKLVIAYEIGAEEQTTKIVAKFGGHENRVKALDTLGVTLPGSGRTTTLMSTASSDGKIFIYDLAIIPAASESSEEHTVFQPISSYDTKGSRLVCLTMADGEPAKTSSSLLGKRTAEQSK
ncbi:WD40 repeat-like protein [Ceratobasidium sp. AG-I]|nr:WD40 repeat-like protein [Ceratobasidium sp. AG-I]